jgi:hypothetical protein
MHNCMAAWLTEDGLQALVIAELAGEGHTVNQAQLRLLTAETDGRIYSSRHSSRHRAVSNIS